MCTAKICCCEARRRPQSTAEADLTRGRRETEDCACDDHDPTCTPAPGFFCLSLVSAAPPHPTHRRSFSLPARPAPARPCLDHALGALPGPGNVGGQGEGTLSVGVQMHHLKFEKNSFGLNFTIYAPSMKQTYAPTR
jgi:hypothetical protein